MVDWTRYLPVEGFHVYQCHTVPTTATQLFT